MKNLQSERIIIFLMRIALGWTFLYAASHQVLVPGWSVTGFLDHTKTFHSFFSIFTGADIAPVITFLVEYGHLLIGLSLILGLFVRISGACGIMLMILYWMAHMNFPYISDHNNFLVDVHVISALVLALLIVKHAGHVWGLDAVVEKYRVVSRSGLLQWATA